MKNKLIEKAYSITQGVRDLFSARLPARSFIMYGRAKINFSVIFNPFLRLMLPGRSHKSPGVGFSIEKRRKV